MGRPQQKPQPPQREPGLKVVEKTAVDSAQSDQAKSDAEENAAADQAREAEAAARRRRHPPRVWPD